MKNITFILAALTGLQVFATPPKVDEILVHWSCGPTDVADDGHRVTLRPADTLVVYVLTCMQFLSKVKPISRPSS